MEFLFILAVFLTVRSCSSFPLVSRNNSHYVAGETRFIWMPDGDAIPHLVDLQEPIDHEILKTRNGNNNQYWLYTRKNPTNYQTLISGNISSIQSSNYRTTHPTHVIVHGWASNGFTRINPLIRDALLHDADCNVIVVDWRDLASAGFTTASEGASGVGTFIGIFLRWLVANFDVSWSNIHLIGYSLGAHILGSTGRYANSRPRITGLDPAGLGWDTNDQALNSGSGSYVEAIHTDGGIFGMHQRVAHADFYPNGGLSPQPGCWENTCSHSRSFELYASTIYTGHLIGRQCMDLGQASIIRCTGTELVMGTTSLTKFGTGIFGLTTGKSWPF